MRLTGPRDCEHFTDGGVDGDAYAEFEMQEAEQHKEAEQKRERESEDGSVPAKKGKFEFDVNVFQPGIRRFRKPAYNKRNNGYTRSSSKTIRRKTQRRSVRGWRMRRTSCGGKAITSHSQTGGVYVMAHSPTTDCFKEVEKDHLEYIVQNWYKTHVRNEHRWNQNSVQDAVQGSLKLESQNKKKIHTGWGCTH